MTALCVSAYSTELEIAQNRKMIKLPFNQKLGLCLIYSDIFQTINSESVLFFIFTCEGSIGMAYSYHPMAVPLDAPQPADLICTGRIQPVQSYAQPYSRPSQVTQDQLPRSMVAHPQWTTNQLFRQSLLIPEGCSQALVSARIL